MKTNKGVTLVSLLIYVAVLLAVVVIIGRITTMFNKNLENVAFENESATAFTNFNACLLTETKKKDNTVVRTGTMTGDSAAGYHFTEGLSSTNCTAVEFSTKNQIVYVDNTIFYNKVKVASNVSNFQMTFHKSLISSEKDTIDVSMTIGGKTYENTYTFR